MSRLTDEELANLQTAAVHARLSGYFAEVMDLIEEVRQWRAIAERDHGKPIGLTAKDREALVWAREWINLHPPSATTSQPKMQRALTILARLTEAG